MVSAADDTGQETLPMSCTPKLLFARQPKRKVDIHHPHQPDTAIMPQRRLIVGGGDVSGAPATLPC